MVYDIFMYNGEDELLEVRLNELKGIVDVFIIGESAFSHSGIEKGLQFSKEKFTGMGNIFYTEIPNMPNKNPWFFEIGSRQFMFEQFFKIFQDDDLIIHGDIDEIPIGNKLKEALSMAENGPVTLCGDYFHLCCDLWGRRSEDAFILKFKYIMEPLFVYRSHRTNFRGNLFNKFENSSNHFSSVGKIENIIKKMNYFAHAPELDQKVLEKEYLINSIVNREYMGAKLVKKKIEELNLPKHLIDNKNKWPYMFSDYYENKST